jgi:hypothetical protein
VSAHRAIQSRLTPTVDALWMIDMLAWSSSHFIFSLKIYQANSANSLHTLRLLLVKIIALFFWIKIFFWLTLFFLFLYIHLNSSFHMVPRIFCRCSLLLFFQLFISLNWHNCLKMRQIIFLDLMIHLITEFLWIQIIGP